MAAAPVVATIENADDLPIGATFDYGVGLENLQGEMHNAIEDMRNGLSRGGDNRVGDIRQLCMEGIPVFVLEIIVTQNVRTRVLILKSDAYGYVARANGEWYMVRGSKVGVVGASEMPCTASYLYGKDTYNIGPGAIHQAVFDLAGPNVDLYGHALKVICHNFIEAARLVDVYNEVMGSFEHAAATFNEFFSAVVTEKAKLCIHNWDTMSLLYKTAVIGGVELDISPELSEAFGVATVADMVNFLALLSI